MISTYMYEPSQLTHMVVITLFRCRCDVMTSQRHRSNIIVTLCVCWVQGNKNFVETVVNGHYLMLASCTVTSLN